MTRLSLSAVAALSACSSAPASREGEWEVVAWKEALYPSQSTNFDDRDNSLSTLTNLGTMRLDAAAMVVELGSYRVAHAGGGEDSSIVLRHEGEELVSEGADFEVGMLEDGEDRPYLMLCTAHGEVLIVCEQLLGELRYPSVFRRDAP